MEDRMTQAGRFRDLMRRDGMIVAPGAYDCITARLIERAGFEAVYMTGAGTAAMLGYPDFGLVTMSEMVANGSRIAAAVELPVIADANAAIAAGADMVLVEAPQTIEEVAAVPRRVNGPCLLNVVRGGKTPDLDLREAERMGY